MNKKLPLIGFVIVWACFCAAPTSAGLRRSASADTSIDTIPSNSDTIPPSASLSLQECIDIALVSHPALTQAKGATQEQEARLESLKVNDRVTVNTGASYGYSTGSGGGQTGSYSDNSYSVSAAASKTLYDSGRNRLNKSAQKLAIRQANESEADTVLTVVSDVKGSYYALLLAYKNLEVAQDQLRNLADHLEKARGYYDVGARPRIDIAKAEVDVANARVEELKAEAGVRLAREQLLVSMGNMNQEPFALATPLTAPDVTVGVGAMTDKALAGRPDYLRAALAVEAARVNIKSAARMSAAAVSANAGGSYGGREFPLEDEFNAGVRLDFPLYDAGESRAATDVARAQLTQVEASLQVLYQNIVYEVRSCIVDLNNAKERIRAAEEAVRYARENLELAQGRYDTGVGSPLEVSDAVSALSQAMFTWYQALYDAQVSVVALERATGGELH